MENKSKRANLLKDSRGDTGFVEWVILVGVIAVAGIAAFKAVGGAIEGEAEGAKGEIEGLSG